LERAVVPSDFDSEPLEIVSTSIGTFGDSWIDLQSTPEGNQSPQPTAVFINDLTLANDWILQMTKYKRGVFLGMSMSFILWKLEIMNDRNGWVLARYYQYYVVYII